MTTSQLESTTKMQKLAPLQKRIQERYVDDEPTKNQMLSQLFQVANVNPLAGCFPALIQIPIFISLYRALQNLVAENKLDEPFLWIPGEWTFLNNVQPTFPNKMMHAIGKINLMNCFKIHFII